MENCCACRSKEGIDGDLPLPAGAMKSSTDSILVAPTGVLDDHDEAGVLS